MNNKLKKKYEMRAQVIKAMAHPIRLYMIELLAQDERNVSDLTVKAGIDISTVSRHLSILKNAGIIDDRRQGKTVLYRLKTPCVMSFFGCIETVLRETGQELLTLSR